MWNIYGLDDRCIRAAAVAVIDSFDDYFKVVVHSNFKKEV